jgi:hypothetical protein
MLRKSNQPQFGRSGNNGVNDKRNNLLSGWIGMILCLLLILVPWAFFVNYHPRYISIYLSYYLSYYLSIILSIYHTIYLEYSIYNTLSICFHLSNMKPSNINIIDFHLPLMVHWNYIQIIS